MGFDLLKKNCMHKLTQHDKSRKGSIDKQIEDLVDKINNSADFFTTSSCSGRIMLIKKLPKKNDCEWLYLTHDYANFDDAVKILRKLKDEKEEVWFKQESLILHVCSRSIEKAQELVNLARSLGLKRSGIQSTKNKIIIEILNNDFIETIASSDGEVFVTEEYLKTLIEFANKKQEKNFEKIKKISEEFQNIF